MKRLISKVLFGAMGAVLGVAMTSALAAESNANPAKATPPAPVVVAPAPAEAPKTEVVVQVETSKLPADATEIVKLSRAKVSEDVILSFVQNSKSSYNLNSDDILRMRNEGVSDRVIGAMLSHHADAVEAAKQPEAPAPTQVDAGPNPTAPAEGQPGEQPPVVTAPLTPSDSAIGYPPDAYYGYPYYPYYYGGPVVAFGFGFPGYYYGHGYYGHYHGHGGIVVHGGGGGGHHH